MKLTANVRQLQDMFSTVDAAGGQIKLIYCRHTSVTFLLQDAVLVCPYISITRDTEVGPAGLSSVTLVQIPSDPTWMSVYPGCLWSSLDVFRSWWSLFLAGT